MPVFKNATAEQVAFALVTAEHDAAGTRKDGVSELEEAKLYASQLLLVGFKEGTTLAMARKQFVTADDAGADGAGADGAGADGAGPDGDEGAAEDDHDATEDSGNVRRAQSVSKRTVVAPASEEEAELDDSPARPQKRAKTNVYASSAKAGKAPESSWSGGVALTSPVRQAKASASTATSSALASPASSSSAGSSSSSSGSKGPTARSSGR